MNLQYGQYPYQADQIPQGYCNAPTNLLTEINGDVVTFSWTAPHPVLYYQLKVVKVVTGEVVLLVNVAGLRYQKQFAPFTDYHAEVKAVCSTDPARESLDKAETDFTTDEHVSVCLPVNIGSVFYTLQPDSVVLMWPAVSEALAYIMNYRIKDTNFAFDKVTVQSNSVVLQGLVYNTAYEYFITTLCKGGTSVDSDTGEFTPPLDPAICPPPQLNVVQNGTSAVVVWQFSNLHLAYDIYINGALYLANYTANIINLSNLDPHTQYIVAVVGRCTGGNSVAGTASFTTGDRACPAVTNLTATPVAENQAQVNWDTAQGVSQYQVYINGSLYEVDTNTLTFPTTPGVTYNITVIAICPEGNSQPATIDFTTEAGCLAIADSDIVSTVGALSIKLDWKDIPGAQFYRWRYRLSGIDAEWSTYTQTGNSQLVKEGLVPNTPYDFEIETTCNVGVSTTVKTLNTTGLQNGSQPVITSFDGISTTGFCVNFTVGDKLKGDFVAKVRNTDTNETTEHAGDTLRICISGKEPHTLYEVIIEDRTPGYTVIPSDPDTVTTCYVCMPVSDLSAAFTPIGDIDINWTGTEGATQFNVYSRIAGEDWKLETVTTDTLYSITDNNFLFREIKVESLFDDCGSSCFATCFVDCATVTGLRSEISGTSGTFSWNAIPGITGYKLVIRSLTSSPIEVFVNEAVASVDNLLADTTYSWTVQAYCSDENTGDPSDAATFTTGAVTNPDNSCAEASFTAIMQDSNLTDGSGGEPSPFMGQDFFRGTAGQTTKTDDRLIGMTKVAVWRGDPLEVIYSGSPLANQVRINLTTGDWLFGQPLDDGEFIYYQWFSS
jgi:hypothetical protein